MAQLMWFLTRASGIVATVLLLAAIADGLIFSGREGGRRLRPAWWMDLHRGLGGYALIFTGVHLITAFGADMGIGLAEIFVPGAAEWSTTGFTLGVLAFYGLAITVFSSWPRRLLRRRAWHLVHLLSIPAGIAAVVHAYQVGTDARTRVGLVLTAVAAGLVAYPLVLRLTGIARRRAERTVAGTVPAAALADADTDAARSDDRLPELVG